MNEHASVNSWSYGEPVLAGIPKEGTIESIVAGVDASRDISLLHCVSRRYPRDISIQEWAKSQYPSSNWSECEFDDNERQTRRKKGKKKRAENDTPREGDNGHDNNSHKKTTKRKHAAS